MSSKGRHGAETLGRKQRAANGARRASGQPQELSTRRAAAWRYVPPSRPPPLAAACSRHWPPGTCPATSACLAYHLPAHIDLPCRLASVPLVCRAWNEAARWCWAELTIDGLLLGPRAPVASAAASFWQQLAAWLRARAPAVRALRLLNLRHLLRELGEEQRRAAVVGVAAALQAAGAATRLDLGPSSVALGPGTLAGLARLASLRSLALHTAGPLDTAELDAVGRGLTQLEELSVVLLRRRGHVCSFRG